MGRIRSSLVICLVLAAPLSVALAAGPLDTFRTVKEEGRVATQVEDLPGRIQACEAFLAAHPTFEDLKPVRETLAEAYLETGTFAPARVGRLFEELAAADPDGYPGPAGFVERYYLKHTLPLDSAQRLLAQARAQSAKRRADLADVEDKRQRERQELSIAYAEADLERLDGALRLVHGDAAGAIPPLERAQAGLEAIPHDILLRADGVKTVPTLPGGLLDETRLALGVAYLRTGKKELAAAQAGQILGFFNEDLQKKWQAELDRGLGTVRPPGVAITADPLPAQEFTLKMLDGKQVKLSDYRGRFVILDFWATWCHWCLLEMPLLDRFQKAHAKDVVLLTINTDRFENRPNILPVLERLNLAPPVLIEDPEQLSQYQYGALPSIYLVDREGRVAFAKTGYDPETKEKLTALVSSMLEGKPAPGRTLLTLETAPQGFGLRFKAPLAGRRSAVAIAPPLGTGGGEVGILGASGLERWSADGEPRGTKALEGSWWRGLETTDLDGDGRREWVGLGYDALVVTDAEGSAYWDRSFQDEVTFGRFAPAGEAGRQGMVIQSGKEIVALGTTSGTTWKTERLDGIEAIGSDPRGTLLVQKEGTLLALDASGKLSAAGTEVPRSRDFAGRMAVGAGTIDFFTGTWDREPILGHDVDGDGREDIVLIGYRSVRAFAADGRLLLRIDGGEERILSAGLGKLDGRPGDEIALLIDKYGLVVLGRN
jgi:thiol-disulfide isomerase/thioredoxin